MAAVPVAAQHTQSGAGLPLLDAERLDVFRVAVEFQAMAPELAAKALASLRDQFERASVSIVLNIGEGAGRRSPRDKRRFYSMARGSAMECGAVLAILATRQLADAAELDRAKRLLVRIVQMLSALERRMGP
jgi:four helix bundle protein